MESENYNFWDLKMKKKRGEIVIFNNEHVVAIAASFTSSPIVVVL